MTDMQKSWALHLGIIALLFVLQFILPAYHHGSLARIMVLTCYAMGYNIWVAELLSTGELTL